MLLEINREIEDAMLRRMIDLVRGGWAQGFAAYDAEGKRRSSQERAAARFSLHGALDRTILEYFVYLEWKGYAQSYKLHTALMNRILHAAGASDVPVQRHFVWLRDWNDDTGRTQGEALALLEDALAMVAPEPVEVTVTDINAHRLYIEEATQPNVKRVRRKKAA